MNNEYLIRLISEYNPHLSGKPFEVPAFRRHLFAEIEPWLRKKQAIAITGLRRTGKTTLMRQLMADVVRERQAVFFSFDEEETQNKEVLVFVLDYAITTLGATILFLDEIHYVDDWEGILKRYYDQRGLKFILSGSESLEISKAKASLAGRLVTFQLNPLSFREYLALKGKDALPVDLVHDDYTTLNRLYLQHVTEKEYFEHEFLEYITKGAFPELVNEEDSTLVRKYIYDLVVKKVIYQDIPAIFDIRRRDILFALFRYACETSSNIFDIQNLSRIFSVHYETVTSYLFYLRTAFLIQVAESYTGSPAKRARRNKKLYVVHPAVACAVLGYDRSNLVEPVLGPLVETLFAGKFFWRDARKNEVDLVIDTPVLLPVEVKYQARISPADLKRLRVFMEVHGADRAILITKNLFDRRVAGGREIILIPAWFALLT